MGRIVSEESATGANQTRERLMRAAETLFARDGIENVSVRAILREAGQRNESAMHYHFGNKDGLVEALVEQRVQQVVDMRRESVDSAMSNGRKPDVRELCYLMVEAPFRLCARDKGFRDFISVFGQRLSAAQGPLGQHLIERKDTRVQAVFGLLREQLNEMDETIFSMRTENVMRFTMLAMSRRARGGGSFRGKSAQLFLNDLADTMAGIFTAPVSNETKGILK